MKKKKSKDPAVVTEMSEKRRRTVNGLRALLSHEVAASAEQKAKAKEESRRAQEELSR